MFFISLPQLPLAAGAAPLVGRGGTRLPLALGPIRVLDKLQVFTSASFAPHSSVTPLLARSALLSSQTHVGAVGRRR